MAPTKEFDVVVIGAGIAGASVAAELSETRRVLLLEQESQPGYHTTGRSAALFTVSYGPPIIRALTRASEAFYRAPPADFTDTNLLSPRGAMFIANPDQRDEMAAAAEELKSSITMIDAEQARQIVPILRDTYVDGAFIDKGASDIDVNALHQAYLRQLRARGGDLRTRAQVTGLSQSGTGSGTGWQVETAQGVFTAPIVVNAAGAWADEIAVMAGLDPAGLTPKRRTALLVAPPDGADITTWPLVVDVEEKFYLKPDAGKLLISPADATPSAPCDAQPDEMDVAICVDRIQTAFDLPVRRIDHKWAGLRSFFPDGCPVAGFDPNAPGFFWLAGQGGYGIQSAPALARASAALITGKPIPGDIADQGVSAPALSRDRAGLAQ
ncbi:MAG: D-arginine dehydrogenase [Paracoccaceae bacterium]|jgi:D-arginine dehydrogenase